MKYDAIMNFVKFRGTEITSIKIATIAESYLKIVFFSFALFNYCKFVIVKF